MLHIDKQRYLDLMRTDGVNAALTELHKDTNVWEIETFEGDQGYSPEMWKDLEEVRTFSRELWEAALNKSHVPSARP